jgi:DNA polymerase-4
LRAGRVTLKVRYRPFDTLTRRRTLAVSTCSTTEILETILDLFESRTPRASRPVRLLGVSTSQFSAQASLLDAADSRRREAVDRAVDGVRARFGSTAVRRGSVLR